MNLAAATVTGVEKRTYGSGVDYTETRINQLQNVVDQVNMESYTMLIYDIPETKLSDCPNPSKKLWRYGFRLNQSCWVLPEAGLNSAEVINLLKHWEEHKIQSYLIPYAEHAQDQIKQIAAEKLAEEIRRAHTSLIERIISADKMLEEAETYGEIEAVKRDNKVRAIIKDAVESFKNCLNCAQLFDETEAVSDLLQALRHAIHTQATLFNIMAQNKGCKRCVTL